MPLVIAQCGSAKKDGTYAAGQLYRSRTHKAILDFMLDGGYACGWDWAILSAKHGLLVPTSAVSAYDLALTRSSLDAFVALYGAAIAQQIESNEAADAVLFIGSRLYLEALQRAIPGRRIQHIKGADRGCGDHFSALLAGFAMYQEDA